MAEQRERQDEREHEELGARDEGEEQGGERNDVAFLARLGDRPLTEEDRPHESRVGRILGQQRGAQHEPRREGREQRRDCGGGTRAGHGATEKIGRPRRARQQKGIQQMGRGRCGGRGEEGVEGREQQRIELTQRRVVGPVDTRHERTGLGDARCQLRGLKLVGHHRPGDHSRRVVRGKRAGDDDAGDHDHPVAGDGTAKVTRLERALDRTMTALKPPHEIQEATTPGWPTSS